MRNPESFKPRILGFLCNWCAYAGADLAGVSRLQYPTNLRVIRVMCSGRVDPALVLEAFINGADGVMVLGCHPGDCQYMSGNYYAERRMRTLKRFLEILGLKSGRLFIDWVSASEGERFSNLVGRFTGTIGKMGAITEDLPLEELRERLLAAWDTLSQRRVRWLVNLERELLRGGNVFGEDVIQEEFNEVKLNALVKEYEKNRILRTLRDKALSTREIAQATGIDTGEVLKGLTAMERDGLVTVSGFKGISPRYMRLGVDVSE